MRFSSPRLLAPAVALTLAACAAGMSKDECLAADWRAVGFEDGARGAQAGAVSSRREACAEKAGVTVDMESYLAGRERGLDQYCQPTNGFSAGERGELYYGVCSTRGEAEFADAYESGKRLFTLRSEVARLENAHAAAVDDLSRLDRDIALAEAALVSPATPAEARIDILTDMKRLHDERDRVRGALPLIARDLARARDDLADHQYEIADARRVRD